MEESRGGVLNKGYEGKEVEPDALELRDDDKESTEITKETVQLEDCGIFCFSIPLLNRLRNPKWFLVFLCWAACIQGLCINGLVNVVITSIERRFGLQSTQSGIIASSYDIGSLLIMIPVTYLGGRVGASKPRWISAGMLFMGLGSFVWIIPHVTTDLYSPSGGGTGEDKKHNLCGDGGLSLDCKKGKDGLLGDLGVGLSDYRYVFIFGQLLHGFGAAPLITLGTTFLDESVNKKTSPLYIAIFQTWFVIGPAIGYVIGGQLLGLHTDLVTDSKLNPSSPLWVGAWWPGFILTFLMSIICAVCLNMYPAKISTKTTLVTSSPTSQDSNSSGLVSSIVSLVTNPTYMLVSLAGGVDGMIISGLAAFLPKFIEQQFRLSNGGAAQLVGLIIVPAGGGGTFFGGWLIKKKKLSRHEIILMCFIAEIIMIPLLCTFAFSCAGPPFVGVNHSPAAPSSPSLTAYYPTPSNNSSMISQCNTDCNCPEDKFDPVCGSDNLMYLSPCLGGCSSKSLDGNNFTSCSCIDGDSAMRISCSTDCQFLIPFVVIQFVGIFMTFFATMPSVVASMRAVYQEERSLALGLQSMILRLCGSIPGPILFGYFVDKSCILSEPSCDEKGSCLVYENYTMSMAFLGVCLVCKIFAILFFGLGYLASKRSLIEDIPEEETGEQEEKKSKKIKNYKSNENRQIDNMGLDNNSFTPDDLNQNGIS